MKWIPIDGGHRYFRADQFILAQIVETAKGVWLLQAETIGGHGWKIKGLLNLEEAQMELDRFVTAIEEATHE